jgi:hypothetical protein
MTLVRAFCSNILVLNVHVCMYIDGCSRFLLVYWFAYVYVGVFHVLLYTFTDGCTCANGRKRLLVRYKLSRSHRICIHAYTRTQAHACVYSHTQTCPNAHAHTHNTYYAHKLSSKSTEQDVVVLRRSYAYPLA